MDQNPSSNQPTKKKVIIRVPKRAQRTSAVRLAPDPEWFSRVDKNPSRLTTFGIVDGVVPVESNVIGKLFTQRRVSPASERGGLDMVPSTSTPAPVQGATDPGNSLSRRYWLADELSRMCYDCNKEFTFFRRRHHCRLCGRIFCGACSAARIPGERYGIEGMLRVCDHCQSTYSSQQDVHAPQPTATPVTPVVLPSAPVALGRSLSSLSSPVSPQPSRTVSTTTGINQPATVRTQEPIEEGNETDDDDVSNDDSDDDDDDDDDVEEEEDEEAHSRYRFGIQPDQPIGQQQFSQSDTEAREVLGHVADLHLFRIVSSLFQAHEHATGHTYRFTRKWLPIVFRLARQAGRKLQPGRASDWCDVREWVKVKVLPGGHTSECKYLSGLAFTKHVTHRHMKTNIDHPRVVLLGSALEYERVQTRLTSLDAVLDQEADYLQLQLAKLLQLKPDILVVQSSVSHQARLHLLNAGVTVLQNVKPSVMRSLSRVTGADILPSCEHVRTDVTVGTCEMLYTHTYSIAEDVSALRNRRLLEDNDLSDSGASDDEDEEQSVSQHQPRLTSKTLCFALGCDPRLQSTILLRGASSRSLRVVKQLLRAAILASYNLRLESSLLYDQKLGYPLNSVRLLVDNIPAMYRPLAVAMGLVPAQWAVEDCVSMADVVELVEDREKGWSGLPITYLTSCSPLAFFLTVPHMNPSQSRLAGLLCGSFNHQHLLRVCCAYSLHTYIRSNPLLPGHVVPSLATLSRDLIKGQTDGLSEVLQPCALTVDGHDLWVMDGPIPSSPFELPLAQAPPSAFSEPGDGHMVVARENGQIPACVSVCDWSHVSAAFTAHVLAQPALGESVPTQSVYDQLRRHLEYTASLRSHESWSVGLHCPLPLHTLSSVARSAGAIHPPALFMAASMQLVLPAHYLRPTILALSSPATARMIPVSLADEAGVDIDGLAAAPNLLFAFDMSILSEQYCRELEFVSVVADVTKESDPSEASQARALVLSQSLVQYLSLTRTLASLDSRGAGLHSLQLGPRVRFAFGAMDDDLVSPMDPFYAALSTSLLAPAPAQTAIVSELLKAPQYGVPMRTTEKSLLGGVFGFGEILPVSSPTPFVSFPHIPQLTPVPAGFLPPSCVPPLASMEDMSLWESLGISLPLSPYVNSGHSSWLARKLANTTKVIELYGVQLREHRPTYLLPAKPGRLPPRSPAVVWIQFATRVALSWLCEGDQCVPSQTKQFTAYAQGDCSLASFLQQHWVPKQRCVNYKCRRASVRHLASFTHPAGRITVGAKRIPVATAPQILRNPSRLAQLSAVTHTYASVLPCYTDIKARWDECGVDDPLPSQIAAMERLHQRQLAPHQDDGLRSAYLYPVPRARRVPRFTEADYARKPHIPGLCEVCPEDDHDEAPIVHPTTPILARHTTPILMWTGCKVCRTNTGYALMSHDTANLSFASFVNLCLANNTPLARGASCPHSLDQHIRFFAFEDVVVNIDVEPLRPLSILTHFANIPPPLPMLATQLATTLACLADVAHALTQSVLVRAAALYTIAPDHETSVLNRIKSLAIREDQVSGAMVQEALKNPSWFSVFKIQRNISANFLRWNEFLFAVHVSIAAVFAGQLRDEEDERRAARRRVKEANKTSVVPSTPLPQPDTEAPKRNEGLFDLIADTASRLNDSLQPFASVLGLRREYDAEDMEIVRPLNELCASVPVFAPADVRALLPAHAVSAASFLFPLVSATFTQDATALVAQFRTQLLRVRDGENLDDAVRPCLSGLYGMHVFPFMPVCAGNTTIPVEPAQTTSLIAYALAHSSHIDIVYQNMWPFSSSLKRAQSETPSPPPSLERASSAEVILDEAVNRLSTHSVKELALNMTFDEALSYERVVLTGQVTKFREAVLSELSEEQRTDISRPVEALLTRSPAMSFGSLQTGDKRDVTKVTLPSNAANEARDEKGIAGPVNAGYQNLNVDKAMKDSAKFALKVDPDANDAPFLRATFALDPTPRPLQGEEWLSVADMVTAEEVVADDHTVEVDQVARTPVITPLNVKTDKPVVANNNVKVTTHSFTVDTYYPLEFHALRSQYCGGDLGLIESLARGIDWEAVGGKSGSTFSKTADDRYLVKYVGHNEQLMMLRTAQQYFQYVAAGRTSNMPSCLVKVLGIYTVSYARKDKEKLAPKYVFLMPNLFYGSCVKQTFDLKGSLRNRYLKKKNNEHGQVLLDQNLLETTSGLPIPLTSAARTFLRAALHNDSVFLAGLSVVDYSLLAGMDTNTGCLVVGIIDYARQYTWDKRLETSVKSVGLLAGKALPTVIPPAHYLLRFRLAMDRYFVEAPDSLSTPDLSAAMLAFAVQSVLKDAYQSDTQNAQLASALAQLQNLICGQHVEPHIEFPESPATKILLQHIAVVATSMLPYMRPRGMKTEDRGLDRHVSAPIIPTFTQHNNSNNSNKQSSNPMPSDTQLNTTPIKHSATYKTVPPIDITTTPARQPQKPAPVKETSGGWFSSLFR